MCRRFDLQGLIIRGVENSFRKYGVIQTLYFTNKKNNFPFIINASMTILKERGAVKFTWILVSIVENTK
jgi:hypothetical protein